MNGCVTCTAITFPIIPKVYSRVQVTLCADQSSSFTPHSVNHLFLHLILCTGELPVILEQKGILRITTAENPLIRSRLTHTFWPPCSVYATHTHIVTSNIELLHISFPHSLTYVESLTYIHTTKPIKLLWVWTESTFWCGVSVFGALESTAAAVLRD